MAGEVSLNQQGTWVSPALPGPTVGSGGVATVVFSTQIAASPARCLEIALDSARYPAWNKFIRKAIIEEAAGPAVVDTLDASLKFLGEGGVRDGLLLPGTRTCFMSYMDPDSDSCNKARLVVTVLKEITHEGRKGFRVAWAMQGGNWIQNAERTQDFIESADGKGTDYFNKETFYGVASYMIKPFVGDKLINALDLWKDGLKSEAEKNA